MLLIIRRFLAGRQDSRLTLPTSQQAFAQATETFMQKNEEDDDDPDLKARRKLASDGGKARAKKLSAEERSQIARKAALARHAIPKATHAGELTIADTSFACAVLEDGTRVISEAEFMRGMGIYRSGALSTRREQKEDGTQIPLSLAHKNLEPYITLHFGPDSFQPVQYRNTRGHRAKSGIKAEAIPKICEVWMDAQKDGVLGPRQAEIASKAEILLRGLARVGITALIDEATGYEKDRRRGELHKILEAYVASELLPWTKRFPDVFYDEMFRLMGWDWNSRQRPAYAGKLTNQAVYERLPEGINDELRRKNPSDGNGRRKVRHHQWLTEGVGNKHLEKHLNSIIPVMRLSKDWGDFMDKLDVAVPMKPVDGDE